MNCFKTFNIKKNKPRIIHRSAWIKAEDGYKITLCGRESFSALRTDQDDKVTCVNCKSLM